MTNDSKFKIRNSRAKLLLHTCCAPCLTAVEEKLRPDFDLTILWFNPNIEPIAEHDKRLKNVVKLLESLGQNNIIYEYDYILENQKWHEAIAGLENEPEGGKRCERCIQYRLDRTKNIADENGFKRFTTTLTVSPRKNSKMINNIGVSVSPKFAEYDFKKAGGYQHSIELSNKYNLYRQKYCGCCYSQR